MAQREELTRFLKAARGRLAPTDVGLPAGERRRTRGLRREEVATLAGMSVTWYTWFEQGREVQLSAAMIERLGKALRLEPQEREFLFALAQHRPPPLTGRADEAVRPSTQQLMDSLSIPALVIVGAEEADAARSYRNLPRVSVVSAAAVGVAEIIGHRSIIATEDALEVLETRAGEVTRGRDDAGADSDGEES